MLAASTVWKVGAANNPGREKGIHHLQTSLDEAAVFITRSLCLLLLLLLLQGTFISLLLLPLWSRGAEMLLLRAGFAAWRCPEVGVSLPGSAAVAEAEISVVCSGAFP